MQSEPFDFLRGAAGRAGRRLVPPRRQDEAAAEAVPLRALMAPGGMRRSLDLCSGHAGSDPRALLSLWSRHYFHTLIPPVVVTSLLAFRRLPLAVAGAAVQLDPQGFPVAVVLPHGGRPAPAPEDPFRRFAALADQHLAPLIAAWAAELRVAPRLLWANAAGYFAWAVREAAAEDAEAARPGLAILAADHRPDGTPNPLREPLRLVEGPHGPEPRRTVCCLLYRLPGRGECGHCPLSRAAPRSGRPAGGGHGPT
ncbi:siderophore-iron reductase FhuF [Teichococcus aerofrigidensis]